MKRLPLAVACIWLMCAGAAAARGAGEEAAGEKAAPQRVTTTAYFTALDGKTEVNRLFVGEIVQARFVAVDGEEVPEDEVEPDIEVHGDSITVKVGKAARIGSIVLVGTEGIVRLVQDGEGAPPDGFTGIEPKDGLIDVRNGNVSETFNVVRPDAVDVPLGPPQEYAVRIDGTATTVVATRANQVAVVGTGLKATTGTSRVELVSAPGWAISGTCPSWGYNIAMLRTPKADAWTPITAQVFGLEPTQRVTFTFFPAPGQQIRPQEATVTAAEALAPAPVASLKTDVPGPQALRVTVRPGVGAGVAEGELERIEFAALERERAGETRFRIVAHPGIGFPKMKAANDYIKWINKNFSGTIDEIDRYVSYGVSLEYEVATNWYGGLAYQRFEAATDGSLLFMGMPQHFSMDLTVDGAELYGRKVWPRAVGPVDLEALLGAGYYFSHYVEKENEYRASGRDRDFGFRAGVGMSAKIVGNLEVFVRAGDLDLKFDTYRRGGSVIRFVSPGMPRAEADFSGPWAGLGLAWPF